MKTIKKLFAIVMVVAMIAALSVGAFAAPVDVSNTYPIDVTVTGIKAGNTLTLYKLVTFNLDAATNEVSYTLATGMPEAYNTIDKLAAITTDGYVFNDGSAANTAADALAYAIAEGTITPIATVTRPASGTSASVTDLPAGWYVAVVTGTADTGIIYQNMIVDAIPVPKSDNTGYDAAADVEFAVKSSGETVEKTVTDNGSQAESSDDYKEGDTVPYTITTKIPNYPTPAKVATFKITDTPTNLTDDVSSVVVKVNNSTVTAGATTFSVAASGDGFVITFVKDYILAHIGQDVVVNYNATVKATTMANDGQIAENTAKITFNPNPNDSGEVEPEDTTKLYNYGIYVYKYKDGEKSTALKNAEFDLKKDETVIAHITTDENGYAYVDELAEGNYTLVETKAPAGYKLDNTPISISVNKTDATLDNPATTGTETVYNKAEVGNAPGTTLPETGGIGTTIFYVVGGILVVGALVVLITKKRMGSES